MRVARSRRVSQVARVALAACLVLIPGSAISQDSTLLALENGSTRPAAIEPEDAASRILAPDGKIGSTFVLAISAPDTATDIYIQSVNIGSAPAEMVLPCVPFQLVLKSPHFIPIVQEIEPKPGETILVNPMARASPLAMKVGLAGQMGSLILRERELKEKNKVVLGANLASWITAGVGLGMAGILLTQKNNIVSEYQKASDPAAMNSALTKVQFFNITVPIGIGLGSAGLISGIVTSILSPNLTKVDRQIKALRNQMGAVGKDAQP